MAGTRCANPEYQLEVDTMMVEYVLYKSVDAHLKLLVLMSRQKTVEQPRDVSLITEQAISALRLTEMYDSLIVLYKKNHGDCLSESTQRNLRILQFLMQLNSWALNRMPDLEELRPQASSEMRDQQKRDMIINQTCRRTWIKASEETQISEHTEAGESWRLRNPQLCLADHLLPLFMWVSTDLFKVSKSPEISPEWMKLASHLMVQGAIEILDAPDLLASGSSVAQNALEECFAWGGLRNLHSAFSIESITDETKSRGISNTGITVLPEVVRMEDECQKMFKGNANGRKESSSQSHPASPSPTWKSVKQEAFEDVLMTFASIQEAGTGLSHRPIELLRNKYRLTLLLAGISEFITIHWELLHSWAWYRKPILVQIEEGGIDGLTPAEFEEFTARARITDMFDCMLLSED